MNWFVEHPEVIRYILEHEQHHPDAICCECGATCTVEEVYTGYKQDSETPCKHSWFSYRHNGQYILE